MTPNVFYSNVLEANDMGGTSLHLLNRIRDLVLVLHPNFNTLLDLVIRISNNGYRYIGTNKNLIKVLAYYQVSVLCVCCSMYQIN